MTLGERSLDDDDENKVDKLEDDAEKSELEIVTTSGRGKNGALCVLQHSIKPVMLTCIPFPGSIRFKLTTIYNKIQSININ